MRFVLDKNHKDFFMHNGYIELEGLLNASQIHQLKATATNFDAWRSNQEAQKILHKKCYATWASELLQINVLRYAFDLNLSGRKNPFSELGSIQEISCLKPLAAGLLFCLEDIETPISGFPLPLKKGNGLYVSTEMPIPWGQLFGLPLLLVVFGQGSMIFHAETKDPYVLCLKKLGYSYNDLLTNDRHPLLIKKNDYVTL